MKYKSKTFLFFCYLISISICVEAQNHIKKDLVFRKYSASFQVTSKMPSVNSKGASQLYLIKLKSNPGEQMLKQLQIVKYLSAQHYIVPDKKIDTSLTKLIEYITPANNNWKATTQLLEKIDHVKSKDSLWIEAKIDEKKIRYEDLKVLCSVKKRSSTEGLIVAKVRKVDWTRFVDHPAVTFVDALRKPKEELIINTLDLTLNRVRTLQALHPNLTGAGINVSLKENLFDTTDIDLVGRYIPSTLASSTISSHATIMATIIGGVGNSYRGGKGAATQTKLSSSNFQYLTPDPLSYFKQYDISIQNHSYGTGIENYYGIEAAAYDKLIAESDTLLHVFSSGNIGDKKPTDGIYNGLNDFANLSGTFKQAKNVLVIGGTNSVNEVEMLSSKGPAYDGRIKPEIVAFGEDGTSGAAAIATGVSALLEQQYEQIYQKKPSSALIKAILINSADDIGNPHVDYSSGFGALNAIKASKCMEDEHFFDSSISPNNEQTFQINVPVNIKQLKVALAWNDPAASVNAPKALVNDLDLWLEDASGKKILPWTLSSYPNPDSLSLPAVRRRDNLNTIEQATIESPPPGTYAIHIKGTSVSTSQQKFAVAYQTEFADYFDWDYPKTNEQLKAGDEVKLRWSSSLYDRGIISYSVDNGESWIVINNATEIENGYFSWIVPQLFTKALLKLELNGKKYISDVFSISSPLTIHVGFNCADSTMLHWQVQPGATGYQIYSLTKNELALFKQTTDTLIVIPKDKVKDIYFAINALGPDNLQGLKGYTLNYTAQGLQCYVQQLLADKTADNKVELLLELGSLYNLKKITWERQAINDFVPIGETEIAFGNSYSYTDELPLEGVHNYRVRIESTNGSISYSDPVSVSVLSKSDFLLFPNPVTNTTLTVLSQDIQNNQFKVFDINGKLVLEEQLNSLLQAVSVDSLVNGIYSYVILKKGKQISKGKFIKL